MHPLYQQLNQNSPQLLLRNNIQELVSKFKNSSNPKQFLLNMMQTNPQTKGIYSLLKNSNKSPKELFYLMAEQKGVNPDDVLSLLN